jgi:hypothetical protein
MHKVNIRGFTKFHPFDALMAHLCVLVLGYLLAVCLLVHDVLEICLGSLQPLDGRLKLCRQLAICVRLHISNITSTQSLQWKAYP